MKIGQYCQRHRCRHVELEQFWQAFASRGFVSDSWAFLLMKICRENNFYIFIPSDLDLWCLELKYASPVTCEICSQRTVLLKCVIIWIFSDVHKQIFFWVKTMQWSGSSTKCIAKSTTSGLACTLQVRCQEADNLFVTIYWSSDTVTANNVSCISQMKFIISSASQTVRHTTPHYSGHKLLTFQSPVTD